VGLFSRTNSVNPVGDPVPVPLYKFLSLMDPDPDREVVMKLSDTSTLGAARLLALASLLLAFGAIGFEAAVAQRLVSPNFAGEQQPSVSSPSASTGSAILTPELTADLLAAHLHYSDAISAYKRITPQTPAIYNKMGMAYQHLSLYNEARYNYDRAIKLDRKYAPAYNNLGTIEYHNKDLRHAERLYRKSIKLEPKSAPFWSNLGAAYLAEKKYRDGAEAYQRAFILNTDIFQDVALNGIHEASSSEDMAKMYLCFAGIYAQAGLKTEALNYLRKALLEGFHDRQAIQQDQQFAALHGDPAFEQLLARQR
jgi:tetratricopeptide (TPR) repeat protein